MYLFCIQGVMRLRKRATLTAVTISAILVISWGAEGILHLIQEYASSVKLSPLTTPIAHMIMIFNSAVNPFAYALLNQRFRKKMKQMVCPRSFRTRVYSVCARQRERQDNEVAISTGDIPMTQKPNWVTGWRQFPGKNVSIVMSPYDRTLCRVIRFPSFFLLFIASSFLLSLSRQRESMPLWLVSTVKIVLVAKSSSTMPY